MGNNAVEVQQLHGLFEYCDDFVFYLENVDGQYIYRYVNKATSVVFQEETPIGKALHEVMKKKSSFELIHANYDQAYHGKKQIVYRDFYMFDKTPTTTETTVIPMPGAKGILAITKQMSTLKVLEEENHFLSDLFAKQKNSLLILDRNHNVLKMNSGFQTFFGKENVQNMEGLYVHDVIRLNQEQKQLINNALIEAQKQKKTQFYFNFAVSNNKDVKFLVETRPILLNDVVVGFCIQMDEYTENIELRESLDQTSLVLEAYQSALNEAANFCLTDADGIIEYASPGYLKLSHYENMNELIGKNNSILNSYQQSPQFYENLWATIKSGKTWRGEICNRSKIGTHFWVDTTIVPIFTAKGEIKSFLSICFDITEKHVMLTNLRNIERTFKLITENTNDYIIITNEDGIVLYVSPNHESQLGYDKDELLGQFYYEVLSEASNMLLRTEINNLVELEGESQIELQLVSKTGKTVWLEAHLTAVEDPTREEVHQFVIIAREITKRKQKEDELRFMAYHDSLTLLPNRRYLNLEFSKLEKQAVDFNYGITILYIDGDNFKRINDVYGHDIGDIFIREFGQSLVKSVRDYDVVARVGGDEFVVMLTHMSLVESIRDKQILTTVERIQNILRQGWMIRGNYFSPTSSIGIASYPNNGAAIDDLMSHADEALYIAKKINGKDSYHITK